MFLGENKIFLKNRTMTLKVVLRKTKRKKSSNTIFYSFSKINNYHHSWKFDYHGNKPPFFTSRGNKTQLTKLRDKVRRKSSIPCVWRRRKGVVYNQFVSKSIFSSDLHIGTEVIAFYILFLATKLTPKTESFKLEENKKDSLVKRKAKI